MTTALATLPVAQHFALIDLAGSMWAAVASAALLYCPGYVLGYTTNMFGFRSEPIHQRSLWALALSLVTVPITAYLSSRMFGLESVIWTALACTAYTLTLLALDLKRFTGSLLHRRDIKLSAFVIIGWTVFALLMLVDFQIAHKLYFSVALADQSYRVAFTDAVVRGGVPPANPLYFAHHTAAMHYYYFWYVLCAAVVKVAHVTARQAFTASSIWAGFGLLATTKLYGSRFFHWSRRTQWIAIGLLAVSGLDLIPSLGNAVLQPLNGDIEWWSVDPIDAWPDSLLWVPHHVASVICCLLAFLFLWHWRLQQKSSQRFLLLGLSAAALASAFGLSVYVACGFAMMLALWFAAMLLGKQSEWRPWLRHLLLAGVGSLVLISPFLLELHRTTPAPPTGAPGLGSVAQPKPFTLSVRRMIDSELVTCAPALGKLRQAHPVALDQFVRLLLLVPGLAMETGLFGMVLVWIWRARRKTSTSWSAEHRTAFFFSLCGLMLSLFVSSSVITNNDFGYRIVMLPQFFWTLLAADLLSAWHEERPALVPPTFAKRSVTKWLVGLGIASSIYGAMLLRGWLPLEEFRPQNGFAQLPEDAYQIRAAFDRLHAQTTTDAVVAFRPIDPEPDRGSEVMTPNEFYQRLLVTNAGLQMLNAEGKCATHFGGNASTCPAIQQETQKLYARPLVNASSARNFCQRFGITFLVLGHRDSAWSETPSGWAAELPVMDREKGFLVVRCGGKDL